MEIDLFGWWMISISSSIVFLTLVSIYIYETRNGKCETKGKSRFRNVAVNFAFVWVLIGLLLFYIVSVKLGSSLLFATGNIVVEALLIVYAIRNKTTTDIPEKNPNEQPGQ
jgi:uncharacterized membrane protein YjfL (UPF0719 family)